MSMLKVENLSVHYGKIQAVHDIRFEANEGKLIPLSVQTIKTKKYHELRKTETNRLAQTYQERPHIEHWRLAKNHKQWQIS